MERFPWIFSVNTTWEDMNSELWMKTKALNDETVNIGDALKSMIKTL